MITSFCKVAFAWIGCAAFALGQGSQLPKYTVATLPAASTQPHYIVQVIDGASSTDCATGGGARNVACVNVAGVWNALGSVSPTFAGTVTVNAAPTYSVHIGPLGTMTASWNFDTTTAATACASLGCSTSGGTVTSFATPSGSWPTWLVPTVTNSTTSPSLAVAASPIPNSALANASTTVNGQTCTLGSPCTPGTQSISISGAGYSLTGLAGSSTAGTFNLTCPSTEVQGILTINLPTAPHGWSCPFAGTVLICGAQATQTSSTTTSATITFGVTGTAGAATFWYACTRY